MIEVGRSRRTVEGPTRRALEARDRHCQWPGCDRSARWTTPHHLKHWVNGGTTDLPNLLLLCGRHHWMVHEGKWQIIKTGDGRILAMPPPTRFRPQLRIAESTQPLRGVIRCNMQRMAIRVLSALIVVIVIAYHGLRLLASQCAGAACDIYIPFSLLLPISALVLAAVAGGMAAYSARGQGGGWVAILATCAVLGSIGPVVGGFLIRDNDLLVWLSTVLILTVPVSVGLHEVLRPQARS